MEKDEILQQNIIQEMKREFLFANFNLTVLSDNGIITLKGIVDNYIKKIQAEKIVCKITGVQSVINKIDVLKNNWEENKDIEIATEILSIFRWNWKTLNDTIIVKVTKGWVTLSGDVEWNYQKEAAKEEVVKIIGVKGVSNNIIIQTQKDITINQTALHLALQNHLALESKNIKIEVIGSSIIINGIVDSWDQKGIAERITWKTPGVINVDNKLQIEED